MEFSTTRSELMRLDAGARQGPLPSWPNQASSLQGQKLKTIVSLPLRTDLVSDDESNVCFCKKRRS